MSRPRTKSPPIQFRLPIDLWPHLQRRAEKDHKTPSDYVRDSIVSFLERNTTPAEEAPT